jgi:hypothetical protein
MVIRRGRSNNGAASMTSFLIHANVIVADGVDDTDKPRHSSAAIAFLITGVSNNGKRIGLNFRVPQLGRRFYRAQ